MERPARRSLWAMMGIGAVLCAGCTSGPRARLRDCERISQTVRSENAQLKDVALKLRTHNQDLAQRTVDDGRRIQALDKANHRLEQSVLAYQEERDRLAAAFEQFKTQLQAAADPVPTALLDRLREFSRSHPECSFDADRLVIAIPEHALFAPDGDTLKPDAQALLNDCADRLSGREAGDLTLRIVARSAREPIRRVGVDDPNARDASLDMMRALRVRDLVAQRTHREPAQIAVARSEDADSSDSPPEVTPRTGGRRIEIHLPRSGAEGEGGRAEP
jgi:outer membrane protein OmpA-like peptidoglycan-associated protein